MSASDFDRLDVLFHAALEEPAAERERFVDEVCGDDAALRQRLRSMLAHDAGAEDPLAAAVRSGQRQFRQEAGTPPEHIGPFRILRRLGRGGMGSVWLGEREDSDFRQHVAIKLLHDLDDSALTSARLRRERHVLAMLEHPNIARLVDGGELEDGTPWVAMEHVEGRSLVRHASEPRLELRARLQLFLQLLDAIAYAHRHLIVHRDIKPANVLVDGDGNVKLLDFGIAKLLDDSGASSAAVSMTVAGAMTPCYASPEQLLGKPVSTQTDVYSLGVVLYELLTGSLPFAPDVNATPLQLQNRICTTQAAAPSHVDTPLVPARRLRGDLDKIVLKALRKEPSRRYASVEALGEDLRLHLAGRPVSARPDSWRYRIGKFVARNPVGVAVSLLLVATLMAFAVTSRWQATRFAAQRDRAETEAVVAKQVAEYMVDLFRVPDPVETAKRNLTARDLLDKAAASLPEEMEDAPRLRARMMHVIGMSYANIGAYKRSERMLESALAIREVEFGADSLEVSDSLNRLGDVYRTYGQLDQAETALTRALSIREHLATGPNAELADAYNNVGLLQYQLGHYQAALPILQRSIDMHRAVDDNETIFVAVALNNRALALHALARYREAEAEVRAAIRIKHTLGFDGRSTMANSKAELASLLFDEGRLNESMKLRRETLARRRTLYPQGHPSLIAGLINMGRLHMMFGDATKARHNFAQAMTWAHKVDSPAKLLVALVKLAQGRLALATGDIAQARKLFSAVLAARRAALPANNPEVAEAEYQTGLAALTANDTQAAASLLQKAMQQQVKQFPANHPERRDTQLALAALAARLGNYAKARTTMQAVIDNAPQERSLRSDLITAQAHRCLATTPGAADAVPNPSTATRHLQSARKLLANYLPAKHPLLDPAHASCPGTNWLATK